VNKALLFGFFDSAAVRDKKLLKAVIEDQDWLAVGNEVSHISGDFRCVRVTERKLTRLAAFSVNLCHEVALTTLFNIANDSFASGLAEQNERKFFDKCNIFS
jgi:hypothetical protein